MEDFLGARNVMMCEVILLISLCVVSAASLPQPGNKLQKDVGNKAEMVNKVKRSNSDDWGLCPQNVDPQACFQQFMSVWLRTVGPRHRSNFRGREVVGKRSMGPYGLEEWPNCPPWMDRLQCFDQYLTVWMNRVPARQEVEKRQNIPNVLKRGGSGSNAQHICPPGMEKDACFHKMMSTWLKDLMVRYPRSE